MVLSTSRADARFSIGEIQGDVRVVPASAPGDSRLRLGVRTINFDFCSNYPFRPTYSSSASPCRSRSEIPACAGFLSTMASMNRNRRIASQ